MKFWVAGLLSILPVAGQTTVPWIARYQVVPNVTYLVANNYESKLDVYRRRDVSGPVPTLVYIHGGGWVGGTKEAVLFHTLPYLEMGWNVVNVEYRLGRVSEAPAAVEDCRCALRWVIRNAKQYGFDTGKIVVTGGSAGGHLALTTGLAPASAGFERICPGPEELKVAAVVNWYGITDVADLLEGVNEKAYAVAWLGSRPDRHAAAKRVSPLTFVRAGLPPVLTIHGDSDPTVPYAHGTELHAALKKAGVVSELHTVAGGKHGNFTTPENQKIFEVIRAFLGRLSLTAPATD